MKTSQKGIDLIKSFEGVRLSAYKAVSTEKYYTIGYGHYGPDVESGMRITQAQADEILKQDLMKFESAVDAYISVEINQNQFDALVSFAFNCGANALKVSTLRYYINQGNYLKAADEFGKWVKSGGIVLNGLARRRAAERELFVSGMEVEEVKMGINTYSKSRDGNKNITSNFLVKEFACKDGSDVVIIDTTTVEYLQKARDYFKVHFYVNSGYRTSAYNKKVGGATNSYHVKGQAVDHHTKGKVELMEMARFYESIGCKGIIVYTKTGFIHIDSRTNKYFAINDGTAKSVSTFGTSQSPTVDKTIIALQTVIGAKPDGIPGKETLSKCPTLRRGDRTDVVAWLQTKLGITADGIFGINTLNAIFKFQRENGLVVDGIFGQKSWRKMLGL